MTIPAQPKIYHIVHWDRLSSIIQSGGLLSDSVMINQSGVGSTIGIGRIKSRRLVKPLNSYPDLCVGQCVPFYFCPRSIMLFLISRQNNPDLAYAGGQEPIVHLEADLYRAIEWAEQNNKRWVFTSGNAGSSFFDDYNNRADLHRINWSAVGATSWQSCKDDKQVEFLVEGGFPWSLVSRIGVFSQTQHQEVTRILHTASWKPVVEILKKWYY